MVLPAAEDVCSGTTCNDATQIQKEKLSTLSQLVNKQRKILHSSFLVFNIVLTSSILTPSCSSISFETEQKKYKLVCLIDWTATCQSLRLFKDHQEISRLWWDLSFDVMSSSIHLITFNVTLQTSLYPLPPSCHYPSNLWALRAHEPVQAVVAQVFWCLTDF